MGGAKWHASAQQGAGEPRSLLNHLARCYSELPSALADAVSRQFRWLRVFWAASWGSTTHYRAIVCSRSQSASQTGPTPGPSCLAGRAVAACAGRQNQFRSPRPLPTPPPAASRTASKPWVSPPRPKTRPGSPAPPASVRMPCFAADMAHQPAAWRHQHLMPVRTPLWQG